MVNPLDPDSAIPGVFGTLYRYLVAPVARVLLFVFGPFISLIKGVLGPVLAIVNYLLGTLGLPNLVPLLNEVLIGTEGLLAKLLGQLSGFVGALLGPQDNIQALSRRRRSITGTIMSTLMSPITIPLGYGWSYVSMPWRIFRGIGSMIRAPFSWAYWGLSYPASGAWDLGGWSTRSFLRMLGFGKRKDDADGENTDDDNDAEDPDPISDLMGTVSETVQDAVTEAFVHGFQVLKSDILPALDSTFESYQESDYVPDSVKGYMKNFHQTYSLLHTLRIL